MLHALAGERSRRQGDRDREASELVCLAARSIGSRRTCTGESCQAWGRALRPWKEVKEEVKLRQYRTDYPKMYARQVGFFMWLAGHAIEDGGVSELDPAESRRRSEALRAPPPPHPIALQPSRSYS